VAIDDISFVSGSECPMNGVCDFQVGLCSWRNVEDDDGDWIVSSNGTGNMGSGPSVDHTYGSGYGNYVHLKTGDMEMGKTAKLESQEMEQINGDGDCFQFWYFLHGR
jgi:hypothetical protein